MGVVQILLLNASVSAVAFTILWLVSIRRKDPSFIDSWWGLGIALIGAVSFIGAGPPGTPHRLALTGLCVIWGVRLGSYLLWRWRRNGPDRRYATMMGRAKTRRGWDYPLASLLLAFALQAPLQFIVSLPVQLGQADAEFGPLGPVAWAGSALALFGVLFETAADTQLTRFKMEAANAGKVMDKGLWRYTRHPNYFGDACVWWGLFLIAAETPYGLWSLPAPLLMTFLLTRWSGVPTVEGRMRRTRPEYEAYVQRTSAFVPWFPKKV